MTKITERLKKMSASVLDGGEELQVGLRVNLKGTAIGVGFHSLGSMASWAIGDNVMKEGQEQAKAANIAFKQSMALGLTQKRILIWSRSAFSGRPKDIIGEMDRNDVSSIDFEGGKLTDMITLNFANGKTLELESVKIDKGEEFVALF